MADDDLENKVEIVPPEKPDVPRIDPSSPYYDEHNRDAAKRLGLRYDRRAKGYVDSDGCVVRDRFGQPL